MSDRPFKYDVAISLLKEDLTYARRLESAMKKVVRGEIFLYTSRQEEVAADPEMVTFFNEVFLNARVVVIWYRPGWGNTAFTQVEENAIHAARIARAGSLDFILPVTLAPPNVPDWFTSNNFYANADLFSAPAIAALVAARGHATGGVVGEEPPAEYARRRAAERQSAVENEQLMRAEGPAKMAEQAATVFAELERLAQEVSGLADQMDIVGSEAARVLTYRGHDLIVVWHQPRIRFRTSEDEGTRIVVRLFAGRCGFHRGMAGVPHIVREWALRLAISPEGVWGLQDETGTLYTCREVSAEAVRLLIDQGEDPQEGRPTR